PVKLFEYLSFGLPVVSIDCKEISAIIHKYGFGITADNTPEAFAAAVKKTLEPETQRICAANAAKALLGENLWIHRAQTVQQDLMTI
ncbi:MAG: glycosyltransferase, partial [Oscillospiraceae bacterium]|nr:glycosyltransferase [Oscillospiraceae bacterium]